MGKDTPEDKAASRGNPSYVWRAGQERRFRLMQRWAPVEHARVLDAGCGVGIYTAAFGGVADEVIGTEIEHDRAIEAKRRTPDVVESPGERLPFADEAFDVVLSHEVLEHVADDRACALEMVRATKPGGRIIVFVPNRLYPFETHGIYWRGQYHFGNIPLVNWLPTALRDRLAPHVRAYTPGTIEQLFAEQPVRLVIHTQIFPGYDNIVARFPALGQLFRRVTYYLEHTPLRVFGLSHFLVLEKT